jgi:hypothetical protein
MLGHAIVGIVMEGALLCICVMSAGKIMALNVDFYSFLIESKINKFSIMWKW